SSRRRHTRFSRDWSSDVCSSDLDLDALIYVGGVRGLADIAESPSHLEIGAAAPYSDAIAAIAAAYPDFGEMLRRLGSEQIRNARSEERRVGKEGRSRGPAWHEDE